MSVDLKVTGLHPKLAETVPIIISEMKARGTPVGLFSGVREHAQQKRLYLLGREIENPDGRTPALPLGSIITNADAFESLHEFGMAGDIVPKDDRGNWTWDWPADRWSELGKFGEGLGLAWGGRWKFRDYPHFQVKCKLPMSEIRKIFFTEGIDELWKRI